MNFIYHRFKSIATLFFVIIAFVSQAQVITDAVKWNYSVNRINDEEAELIFKADIGAGWHLYSQFLPEAETRPVPTSFTFTPSKAYERVGKVKESKTIKKYEDAFEMELQYFEKSATFTQKIKVKSKDPVIIKGTLEFMVCNDQQCLPPDSKPFEFKLDGNPKAESNATDVVPNNTTGSTNTAGSGCPCDSLASMLKNIGTANAPKHGDIDDESLNNIKLTLVDSAMGAALEPGCGDLEGEKVDHSFWGIFLGGFLGGFLALLTPCVFPMIPLTVSFFTKQSKNRKKGIRNAIIYGLSIIVIYVSLGFIITVASGGSDSLNAMASNVYFNLLFFVIFIIFAMSFLGAFEITLPSALVNKADAASERGGLIGIFFMAFTLSLVSFSCTGPIIGTLLVEAARGSSYLGPLIGMFGFSLALALPFALFAAFPGWLNSLPKSGGWLNSVKVSLGFVELALALKFLSNVDLAYHWGFLKRELFLAVWVVVFGLWGFYLLGKLRLSHDSESKNTSVIGLSLAILVFTFVLYLVPGIWGAPVKFVSGYLPPSYYKEWGGSEGEGCPAGINCFHDYETGMKYAKKEGKPVMIDFTGYSCVNCRRMEDNVWTDPRVTKRLSQDYVLISLYVDDKSPLPPQLQYKRADGSMATTYGQKWSDLEVKYIAANSQPQYLLLDNNGSWLAHVRGYTPDKDMYVKFLDEGLCRYKKRVEAEKEKKK